MTLTKGPLKMKLKRYVECSLLELSVDKVHENESELERTRDYSGILLPLAVFLWVYPQCQEHEVVALIVKLTKKWVLAQNSY